VGLCVLLFWLISLPNSELPPRAGGLRVASANLLGANAKPADASRYLAQIDSDLLVMTEWTGANLEGAPLREAGWKVLLNAPSEGLGMLVLARSSIEAEAKLVLLPPIDGWEIPVAIVRVETVNSTVSVLGIHVPPPVPRYHKLHRPTILAIMRWVQAGRMEQAVGPSSRGDVAIIVGDFNALPWSEAMSSIGEAGLLDAWAETNWRPGPTWGPWPAFPSVARIDYVFASAELSILGCWTLDLPGSDHRIVVAEVSVSESDMRDKGK